MKPNIHSLNYGTLYLLRITPRFIAPFYIGTIIIIKYNAKILHENIIEITEEKRVCLRFSYHNANPTIILETRNYTNLSCCVSSKFIMDQITNTKKIEPPIFSKYWNRNYYGDKNRIFKIVSSLPIITYDKSSPINIFNPHFIRVENGMAHHTNWTWKDVKWHVMKALD